MSKSTSPTGECVTVWGVSVYRLCRCSSRMMLKMAGWSRFEWWLASGIRSSFAPEIRTSHVTPDVENIILGIRAQKHVLFHEPRFSSIRFLIASNASSAGLNSPRSILAEECASILSSARLSCVCS